MSLFQKTVFKEFVASQNQNAIQEAFEKYQAHFANPDIKANIHTAKEEQYQEGFLQDLFVKVLGYTLYPQANHNLITEQKTATSAKKSDAAILQNGKVIAVIELKSTRVFDLRNIEGQAFAYKNAQPDCRYVITSNFAKMRFYLDNTLFYEEFDLFEMTLERFAQLYTILQVENMLSDLPLELKARSVQKQEEITVAFYNDYQAFKEVLFTNIYVLNKSKYDELLLFGKTQRLIDRIIFLCFASDKAFLPLNLVDIIVQEWEDFNDAGMKVSLYDRFKAHFEFINSGFKSRKYDIYAFNGGLFAKDEVLDNIQIGDNVLKVHTEKIAFYNFDADVDVNVLGHIFEYSLHQLDQKRQEIIENAKKQDKANAENGFAVRKVEGIFYTPIYVINYIIEETLGKFCKDKKAELTLDFTEIDFTDQKQKDKIAQKLKEYETWLEDLSVLDPACGSGAFLNQVLSFFMQEYSWLESLKSGVLPPKPEPKKDTIKYDIFNPAPLPKPKPKEQDIVHKIMENNVFGVDINFESVAITQLSLWLRMAQGKRKLNNMTAHIKEGNSLIDDKKVAKNAFDWAKEFPTIFKNKKSKGFRLIVGNPPYVDIKTMPNDLVKHYFKHYETAKNRINLYALFIERGLGLLQEKGTLSFIVPNSLLVNSSYLKLRKKLYKGIETIVKMPDNVFDDANVETIIFTYQHNTELPKARALVFPNNFEMYETDEETGKKVAKGIKETDKIKYQFFDKKNWNGKYLTFNIYADDKIQALLRKCFSQAESLADFCDFSLGITPYDKYKGHSPETIQNRAFHADQKLDDTYKPCIAGSNISRYFINENPREYIKYGDWLGASREEKFFTAPRIIIRQILSGKPPRIYASFTDKALYFTQIGFSILSKNSDLDLKYILALLNSKLLNFLHTYKFTDVEKSVFGKILIENAKNLPIKKISTKDQKPFIDLVNILLAKNEELHTNLKKFTDFLRAKYQPLQLKKKVENYHILSYAEFLGEIKKSKIRLTSMQKEKELGELFMEEKNKAVAIQEVIQQTEQELDKMIYALYGLSQSEIEIVEKL